uniref:Ion transport domain-containing protein n=1 Tax=Esox lucius TaxID=8010 RepID=A0A6Q2ZNY1_ESOLU
IRDQTNASLLHYASSHGHIGTLKLIVQLAELSATDDRGNTPLHWAVQRNQGESCACLLDLGADPNIRNLSLRSPLHMAVRLGHNALVELLLSHNNTDVNLEGELGNTPVMMACSIDNHEALHILFKYSARLCQQNKLGHYPIHKAAFAGAELSMRVLLQKGEELGCSTEKHINYLDKSYSSPLHLAVRGGNLEVIKLCIEQGAKMDQQQCDKSTALHFACTQGATEAVKLLLSKYHEGSDVINIRDGALQTPLHKTWKLLLHTPLLLATSCSAWKTVELLLSHGANLKMKDKYGCNFLHLAVLQPKGLNNLPSEVLQHSNVRELLSAEDNEGCTPLHYACRLGIPESVENMLSLNVSPEQKSNQNKSALHFAAEYGRINTCLRLLEGLTNPRLLNEGDEKGRTPLHLASRGGHVKVVKLLLRKGALFHSDYKGWTCLHHAAAEGYTQTMSILLAFNYKLLDKTDDNLNTALHLASRQGHASAVTLLLNRGAKIMLNKSDASFLHEAVLNGRKDATIAVINSDRLNCYNYSVRLFCLFTILSPVEYIKLAKTDKSYYFQPLAALNAMVRYNRIELLTHPVCKKYLKMKWNAYGIKVHLLNLAMYCLGLLPLTHIIHALKPHLNTNVTSIHPSDSKLNTSIDKVQYEDTYSGAKTYLLSYITTACIFLVLVMNLYTIGKELVQVAQQGFKYFRVVNNALDWGAAVSSMLFIIPLLMNQKDTWHWEVGAVAVLLSWINFLLYFQRFERVGIYIVMFSEIAKTLLSITVLFFFLLLAFALSFYTLTTNTTLLTNSVSIPLAIIQTFVMMVGELNYQENILKPFRGEILPFPYLTYGIFVMFTFAVPILLMNLLIGLAVGDTAEVKENAVLKQIGMQIELHTSLEEKMPYWLMKRVDHKSLTEYPNKTLSGKVCEMKNVTSHPLMFRTCLKPTYLPSTMEQELIEQKYRMKEMSTAIENQHNLLKLILQKMEISSEAEEGDDPQLFRGYRHKDPPSQSKWSPLLRALANRKNA